MNDQTHFKNFQYNKGSGTDFLGFDNGLRSLNGGINATLRPMNNGYDLLNNGLNNDWSIKEPQAYCRPQPEHEHRPSLGE